MFDDDDEDDREEEEEVYDEDEGLGGVYRRGPGRGPGGGKGGGGWIRWMRLPRIQKW